MEDTEETLEDEEVDGDGREAGEPAAGSSPAGSGDGEDVESIQDLLVKQEAGEEEADESVLTLTRDDLRDESVAPKVVPPQANEFTCRKCYLVKHRSQLKDKTRMLCRDCA